MSPPSGAIWQAALAHVPGSDATQHLEVQPLAGGSANATFRVRTREGAFVVRLHEPYTLDLGVDRRREAILHALAATAGLASQVLAADPAGRYLVTEYLDGAAWREADLEDESRLSALAQTLSELHGLPAPRVPPLEPQVLLERHLAQIVATDAAAADELVPQVARAQDILARQADAGRPACIIHGDLSHANIIGQGQPRLIDWEYAAVADPLVDLACLVAYYPRVLAHADALLARCGMAGTASLVDLEDLARVYRLLSNLWYRRLALARRHPRPAH
jgi:aminoglycoside phosphotransferase (APT) family kinase protein